MERNLEACVVRNDDFRTIVEEFDDFNIEDYKKYKSDDNYIYIVTDEPCTWETWNPNHLFLFILSEYEVLTEEEIKTLLEDIDFNDYDTYINEDAAEEYFFIEHVCKCPLLFEKVNHDLMLELGDFEDTPTTDIELKEYLNELGIHASDETIEDKIEYLYENGQLCKIEGLSEVELIDYVIENLNTWFDEYKIEPVLENIDFDNEELYEKLAENNTIAEDIMSVPKLAEKVNHNYVWFNLPISFTIDKDTTLEEYKDYIYDELGLDIEDYLIEERYNTVIEDLKNED